MEDQKKFSVSSILSPGALSRFRTLLSGQQPVCQAPSESKDTTRSKQIPGHERAVFSSSPLLIFPLLLVIIPSLLFSLLLSFAVTLRLLSSLWELILY
jgi:hypothetical protein